MTRRKVAVGHESLRRIEARETEWRYREAVSGFRAMTYLEIIGHQRDLYRDQKSGEPGRKPSWC